MEHDTKSELIAAAKEASVVLADIIRIYGGRVTQCPALVRLAKAIAAAQRGDA